MMKALLEQIGMGPDSCVFTNAFADMGIAEEVLDEAGARNPGNDCFRQLQRPEMLRGKPEWLFRAHCRELVDRYQAGRPMEPGTWAEVAVAMSTTSLAAPLNSHGAFIAWRAMSYCSLDHARRCWAAGEEPREPWQGFERDEVEPIRRRLASARG